MRPARWSGSAASARARGSSSCSATTRPIRCSCSSRRPSSRSLNRSSARASSPITDNGSSKASGSCRPPATSCSAGSAHRASTASNATSTSASSGTARGRPLSSSWTRACWPATHRSAPGRSPGRTRAPGTPRRSPATSGPATPSTAQPPRSPRATQTRTTPTTPPSSTPFTPRESPSKQASKPGWHPLTRLLSFPLGQHRREPASVVRPLETPRAAGLAFAALFIASVLLLRNHPAGDSTAAEIRDFCVGQNAGRIALVGVYLAPFAGIAFLWFIAVIRNLIGDREDRFFATVFLGSGLLFVAMLFISAGAGGALMAAVKFQHEPVPSPDTVVTIRSLAFGFLFVYAMRMAAVFMIVVSTIGMRLGIVPRWLVVGGYAAALVLILNVSYIELLILVFPAWVAAVSVVILTAQPYPRRDSDQGA